VEKEDRLCNEHYFFFVQQCRLASPLERLAVVIVYGQVVPCEERVVPVVACLSACL